MTDAHVQEAAPQEEHLLPNDPPAPRRNCKCGRCCTLVLGGLIGLVLGAIGGGVLTFFAVRSIGDSAPIKPIPPACGACELNDLEGRFVGNVSQSEAVLGHTLHVRYTMVHSFRNGSVDVSLTAIESPFSILKSFSCPNVPFVLDRTLCNLTISNACMATEQAASQVAEMAYVWDGANGLTVYETVQLLPGLRKNFMWTERA